MSSSLLLTVTSTTELLGWGGLFLVVGGIVAFVFFIATDEKSWPRQRFAEYEEHIEKEVRFQLWKTTGKAIARAQLGVILAIPVVSFLINDPIWLLLLLPATIAPYFYLQNQHDDRLRKLEDLLDSWLLMLANALKASPSLGEAISNSAKLIRPPFSEEIDLVLKEMKLGTPLDQAVLNMSRRINSRVISSSLATILVGRQTGGDLPNILETSASTLREMARLEGVVRTKTAEGKMQVIVLAVIPFALLGMIHYMDNTWLRPLVETTIGYGIIAVATALWMTALILARRILSVDI
ncbi:MAG: type II secretion system F family protein [Sandaracinus sp.]